MLLIPTNCLNKKAVIPVSQGVNRILKEIFQIHQVGQLCQEYRIETQGKGSEGLVRGQWCQ